MIVKLYNSACVVCSCLGFSMKVVSLLGWWSWLHITMAALLHRDGVLIEEEGITRVVSGAWTVVVVLQAPTPPDISLLTQQIQEYQDTLEGHVTAVDTYVWTLRLNNLRASLETGNYRVRDGFLPVWRPISIH